MTRWRDAVSLVPRFGPGAVPDGWRRPPPDASGRLLDGLVAVLLAVGCAISVVLQRAAGLGPVDSKGRPSLVEGVAWCLAVTLPLAVRRRYPQTVLVVVGAAFIALQARGVEEYLASQISLFLALFTVGAWAPDRLTARWTRGVVVAAMFGWLTLSLSTYAWDRYLAEHHPRGPVSAVLAVVVLNGLLNVLYFVAAWGFGDLAWRSAGERAVLEQRNTELARERDENARRAVLDERIRIARELHDVVAHHVSVMGVQAGAARIVLDADPAAARTALGGIERAARQAVDELHQLLGVLRGDPGGPDRRAAPGEPVADRGTAMPAPSVDGIPELVDVVAAGGLQARYTVVGEPVPMAPGLSVSVYRIVQEALTNTVRHAGAARVDVRLRYLTVPAAVEAEIVDDGRSLVPGDVLAPAAGPDPGTGRRRGLGLVGMRERASLHGGELEVGPRPEGGFRVRARFPLVEAAG